MNTKNISIKSLFIGLGIIACHLSTDASQKKVVSTKKNTTSTPAVVENITFNKIIPNDSKVKIGKLSNGLTYYIRKNTEPKKRAELYLVVKAGSILEADNQQGLAHFAEHMAFNGCRDFPKNALVDYLQKAGVRFGADLNAYTSFDETVYQLPIPTDSTELFKNGFKILANWAGYVTFDANEIDKERGVVLEEARLRGKNAQERMQNQYLPILLNNSKYATRLPIGKEAILKTFSPETIKQFYTDWYRPNLQAIIAVGDFDTLQVEQLIKENFSGLKNPEFIKEKPQYQIPAHKETYIKKITDNEYPYTVGLVFYKHPKFVVHSDKDLLKDIQINLINQMISARLNELLQRADPPFIYASSNYGEFLAGLDAFTTTAVGKPGELLQALKTALEENIRIKKFGFTPTEFKRAKEGLMNNIEQQYNERNKTKSHAYVSEYQNHFTDTAAIPSTEYSYQFHKKHLQYIKLEDVNTLAQSFITDENRVVLVLAPDNEKDKLPTDEALTTLIGNNGTDISNYIDDAVEKPLLDKAPQGGKLISEQKITELDITELKLNNGVKIILKPTDFKNDQILFAATSPGGSSLVEDSEFQSANMATTFVTSSGISDFKQTQLEKLLTGKTVEVNPTIKELSEGIEGSTNPKDFETALQLVYLYFLNPRKDADVFKSIITQTKANLTNRGLDPMNVFRDSIAAVLSNYSIRRMTPSIPQIEAINLERVYQIYKDRFADASDFTFFFVGNFDVEKIKPLLLQYLGGLPAINRQEKYKDLNIQVPNGRIVKKIYKGKEPKSMVRLVYSGDYNYSDNNNIQMSALEEILNIKLIERLREREGGVYSPRVSIAIRKIPSARYSINISFGCAPENVERLINASLEEIEKIKGAGAEQSDIKKFVAETKRANELQLKENTFWLNYLNAQYELGEDPKSILHADKDLENVTIESTKTFANQYLNEQNFIQLILFPEE